MLLDAGPHDEPRLKKDQAIAGRYEDYRTIEVSQLGPQYAYSLSQRARVQSPLALSIAETPDSAQLK